MPWSIVGFKRAPDGLPGSWTPDIPDGIQFTTHGGETTASVQRLRDGTDANSPTADPNRLVIIKTPRNFRSPSRVKLGDGLNEPLHDDGRYLIELAIGRALPVDATVRRGIRALLRTWSLTDDNQPNPVRPDRDGNIKLGGDIIDTVAPPERVRMRDTTLRLVQVDELIDGGLYVVAEFRSAAGDLMLREDYTIAKMPRGGPLEDQHGRVRIAGTWVWPTQIIDGEHVDRPDLMSADQDPAKVPSVVESMIRASANRSKFRGNHAREKRAEPKLNKAGRSVETLAVRSALLDVDRPPS